MSDIPCMSFSDVFTTGELTNIRLLGETAQLERAAADGAPREHRSCSVAWVQTKGWLGEKLSAIVREINEAYFHFDLSGFAEPFQYTVYGRGEYYRWHIDKGAGTIAPRKLSLTVQLSQPEEYAGGDFQVRTGSDIVTMPRKHGEVLVFPSWILHRVQPVTRGIRRSLVVWTHGESFR